MLQITIIAATNNNNILDIMIVCCWCFRCCIILTFLYWLLTNYKFQLNIKFHNLRLGTESPFISTNEVCAPTLQTFPHLRRRHNQKIDPKLYHINTLTINSESPSCGGSYTPISLKMEAFQCSLALVKPSYRMVLICQSA